MKIYTKTGDQGETALFGGKRVPKCHELVDAYGSIDELNSWLGLLLATGGWSLETQTLLLHIQSDLFTIGGSLAGWSGDLSGLEARVGEFEKAIDSMDTELPELRNFILPGGTLAASHAHLARAVCRRVERQVVALVRASSVVPRVSKKNADLSSKLETRTSKLANQISSAEPQTSSLRQGYGRQANLEPRDADSAHSAILIYLNRLSDLLFVLARYINKSAGQADIVWHVREKIEK